MGVAIAMILANGDSPIDGQDVARVLAEKWPNAEPAIEIEGSGESVSFHVGDSVVAMARMPAPFPWSDLEGPCATSILWPNAADEVRGHTCHWIVTVIDETEPLAQSTLLTQVTSAALASCPDAIGVYWGNSTMVIPKGLFIEFAETILPHGPPLHIWVDFRVGPDERNSGGSAGFTSGMTALGHMEFETRNATEPPRDLLERLTALASYVVEHGPVIGDGHTVGQDEEECIRVVYAPSTFGHEGQVMRLDYENVIVKKPWWRFW